MKQSPADVPGRASRRGGARRSPSRRGLDAEPSPSSLGPFLEALPHLAWLALPDGRVEQANRRWSEAVAGSEHDERWLAAVHPDDRAQLDQAWSGAVEAGQPLAAECRLRTPEGGYRWSRVYVAPFPGLVPPRWLGTATDSDALHRMQETLAFLSEANRMLLASPDPRQGLIDLARRAIPGQADWCLVHVRQDGDRLRRLAVAHADPDRVRRVEALPGDLLAQVAGLEKAVESGQAHLIADLAPEGGAAVGGEAAGDAAAVALVGELGLRSSLAIPIVTHEGLVAALTLLTAESGRRYGSTDLRLAEALGSRVAVALESWHHHRERRKAEALAEQDRAATAFFQESNRQEQAARAEAEAANRAKDEFLAMISHELRTPLGAILIWSQLLRNETLDEKGTLRAVGMIERSTKTLAKIIDDLLDVSRIISGKLRLEARAIELPPVIEAAVEAARPEAAAKGVTLDKAIEPDRLSVSGDPVRLQQVVGNLLSNAVKFTTEGGRVEVRLQRLGSNARVTIADTGMGINPDFLPYIFERFRQADSTSTRRHKGLGLGLAIARHLVDLHGGKVEAASEGEDRGSTFTVTLPLLVVTAADSLMLARTEEWPLQERVLDGLRILLVDDEDDARDALALLLERCGARVTSARSAQEAFAAIQAEPHDVLLSDIAMPAEDGYSLLQRIRALPAPQSAIPAAAVTAYATREDRERALRAGYSAHLAKPVNPAALVGMVLQLTGRPALARAPAAAPPSTRPGSTA